MSVPAPTVLVVDDEESIRDFLELVLEEEGYAIELAGTVGEAIALLADRKFDVALLDKNLPDGSGLDIARHIQDRELDTACIMITAYGNIESAVEALRLRIADYLQKPLPDIDAIAAALRRVLAMQKLERENRELLAARTRSEEAYRTLVTAIPASATRVDRDGVIEFTNRVPETRTLGDIIGTSIFDPLEDDDRQRARDVLASVFETGAPGSYEAVIDKRHFRTQVVPLPNAAQIDQVLLVSEDITEKVQAQKLERQLQQSNKLEALGKLAGGVAHDFNNLLTVIMSYARFVESELADDDPSGDDIRQVLGAAERAAGLTRQLLVFSREKVSESGPIDVNGIVGNLEQLLGRVIGEDIALDIELAPVSAVVIADAVELDRVLLNLAGNARDAMLDGGALRIAVDVVNVMEKLAPEAPGPGRHVRIRVADSGSGMDEHTRAHVFEPFFTTKGPTEGTGLGLATCYGVIKGLDGAIEVTSAVGAGTTFTIHLPCVAGEANLAVAESTDPRGQETVLLVEDEPDVRAVAERVMSACGYNVLVADDAPRALELLDEHGASIDLLFSDVVLPRGNGVDLAQAVRDRCPETTILLTSGYSDQRTKRAAEFPILWKPYSPETLACEVRARLDRRRRTPVH